MRPCVHKEQWEGSQSYVAFIFSEATKERDCVGVVQGSVSIVALKPVQGSLRPFKKRSARTSFLIIEIKVEQTSLRRRLTLWRLRNKTDPFSL